MTYYMMILQWGTVAPERGTRSLSYALFLGMRMRSKDYWTVMKMFKA